MRLACALLVLGMVGQQGNQLKTEGPGSLDWKLVQLPSSTFSINTKSGKSYRIDCADGSPWTVDSNCEPAVIHDMSLPYAEIEGHVFTSGSLCGGGCMMRESIIQGPTIPVKDLGEWIEKHCRAVEDGTLTTENHLSLGWGGHEEGKTVQPIHLELHIKCDAAPANPGAEPHKETER